MDLHRFEIGSPTHIATVLACVCLSVALALSGPRIRRHPGRERVARRALVSGCLLVWIASSAMWWQASPFRWEQSLPLHFCNAANLIGAWAVATRHRLAQGLIYFWFFALCSVAFVMPFLFSGPATLWFWIFWAYHLFIALSVAWVLGVDRYRPGLRDAAVAFSWTLLYTGALFLLNLATGWNYGFVGPDRPNQPAAIAFFGPWPLRVLWMVLVTAALFLALALPWRIRGAQPRPRP